MLVDINAYANICIYIQIKHKCNTFLSFISIVSDIFRNYPTKVYSKKALGTITSPVLYWCRYYYYCYSTTSSSSTSNLMAIFGPMSSPAPRSP